MIPECDKTTSGVVKTSSILIAAGNGEPEIYRSLDDVPGPMRRLLTQSTEGENSGTIWIADQRGREEIGRALEPSPCARQRRLPLTIFWLSAIVVVLSGVLFALLRNRP